MGIFDRFKRSRDEQGATGAAAGMGAFGAAGTSTQLLSAEFAHELPTINQRVTIAHAERPPSTSRVDDVVESGLVLADPGFPLEAGDLVVVTWESERGWFGLETLVTNVDRGPVPNICVAREGRLQRYAERRRSVRREVSLPLELRIGTARVVKTGQQLNTHTTELGDDALKFITSAPLVPGDLIEAKIELPDQAVVGARVKVIRMDSVSGAWRQTCTVAFHEILRSDRTRLRAFLDGIVEQDAVEFSHLEPPMPRNQG